MFEYLKTALEPELGFADNISSTEHGLRFHPLDHWNRWREPDMGDWGDSLDGIRLEWNQDVINADDPETPGRVRGGSTEKVEELTN